MTQTTRSPKGVGGLSGGLFNIFDVIGRGFFTFLIGRNRANRPELQTSRVVSGSMLAGFSVGACGALLAAPRIEAIAGYGVLGAVLAMIIGSILNAYVGSVEREIAAEEERALRQKQLTAQCIAAGMSPEDAAARAALEVNRTCVIATLVFGSVSAKEVEILRAWRDDTLLRLSTGRRF